jgi:hypothetical protein
MMLALAAGSVDARVSSRTAKDCRCAAGSVGKTQVTKQPIYGGRSTCPLRVCRGAAENGCGAKGALGKSEGRTGEKGEKNAINGFFGVRFIRI